MCVFGFGSGFRVQKGFRASGSQVFVWGSTCFYGVSRCFCVLQRFFFLTLYGTVNEKIGELMKESENQSYDPGK